MRKINSKGKLSKVETLSDKQIKEYIIKARGYTGTDKQKTKAYQKEYDKLRNQTRRYERGQGISKKNRIAINKLLYDITRREVRAAELGKPVEYTQEQLNIFKYTTGSSTGKLSKREIQVGQDIIFGQGAITIAALKVNEETSEILSYKVTINPTVKDDGYFGRFSAFILKTTLIDVKGRLERFLTNYYNKNKTLPLSSTISRYLASMADELHALQDNDRQAQGSFYRRNGRRGGS